MVIGLLRTKLHVPRVREGMVNRPRLMAGLSDGLAAGKPLTLVSAPAGYGKTTLIADWVERTGTAHAWLALDGNDNDPVRFLTYLIEALRTIRTGLGEGAMALMTGSGNMLPVQAALVDLLNELSVVTDPMVLVLDDFHCIDNGVVTDMVGTIIENTPPCLHLVITTREDPALPLPRLRVRDRMTEIRMDDLRFNQAEAGEFLSAATGLPLNGGEIETLGSRTEGWIAGLQLAALSLKGRGSDGVAGFIRDFGGSHRYVMEYLMSEVVEGMDPVTRDFITRTAVVDRFNADLGEHLTGQDGAKAVINRLGQANLFLVPLDDEGRWFRYHHLFAQFLRTELSVPEKARIHRMAAEWFTGNGFPEEGIGHALAAGEFGMALGLVKAQAPHVFNRGEMVTLLGWLKALPSGMTETDPGLLGYMAWSLFLLGRIGEAVRCLAIAPVGVDPMAEGRLMALRGWMANYSDDPDTKDMALAALDKLGDGDPIFREVSLISLGHAQRRNDRIADSTATLYLAYGSAKESGHTFTGLGALLDIAMNMVIEGKRREGIELCRSNLASYVDGNGNPLPMAELLRIPLGILEFEGDGLAQARDSLERGLKASHALGINRILGGDAEQVLAQVHLAIGDPRSARELLETARECVDAGTFPIIHERYGAFLAQLALWEGDTARAMAWVESSGLVPMGGVTSFKEVPLLVVSRILHGAGRHADALEVLDGLRGFDLERGRHGRLIHVEVLRSRVLGALGRDAESRAAMEWARRFGAAEGYVRPFLIGGAGMGDSCFPVVPPPAVPGEGMIEAFSERETEVLRLLAAGSSNVEIGEALFISLGTVKWHVRNIFGKLGVGNRTGAVAKARGLGIID